MAIQLELKRQRQPVAQAKNDVLEGIRATASLFIAGELIISSKCKNLIKEIQGYVWDEKSVKLGEDKPLKQRDHALDALRYAIYSHWGHKSTLKQTSESKPINPMNYEGWGPNSWGWQRM
jgi:phage terminase large subunit